MSVKISVILSVLAMFLATASIVAIAEDVECPLIADTEFSGHAAEHTQIRGGNDYMRLKGDEIACLKFDMSRLEGQDVNGATLSVYCTLTGGITSIISTIAHDWDETASTYDFPGGDLGEEWAKQDNDGQSRNGVQITVEDVLWGFGDSIVNSIKEINLELNEWTEVELDAELVQGLVDGEQYGIAMKQAGWSNLDIASKELGNGEFAAKLVVHVDRLRAVKADGKLTTSWGGIKEAY